VTRELHLTLDFACACCEGAVSVTVQCRGEGLCPERRETDGTGAGAVVHVPCPTCGQTNHVTFEPTGLVQAVRPMCCYRPLPQPSVN
jgi:hypothetical protein